MRPVPISEGPLKSLDGFTKLPPDHLTEPKHVIKNAEPAKSQAAGED